MIMPMGVFASEVLRPHIGIRLDIGGRGARREREQASKRRKEALACVVRYARPRSGLAITAAHLTIEAKTGQR